MLTLPHSFGRYTLTRMLGEGGMAEVYQASVRVAEGLTKWVVIKKIKPEFAAEHEFTRMFVDEAKIALSLNHANIVQVFDFGQIRGDFYLAMELIEGLDLMRLFHAVKAKHESFPAVIAAYICHQAASGLSYAHRKKDDYGEPLGIVHRDVSPHNVMLSFDGQVKVLDFGVARTRRAIEKQPRMLAPGEIEETIKGKVAYMSPEQAAGKVVDARSDVYSLGVVMYELLTGELLYRGRDRMAQLERVRTESLPPILERAPEIPDELARIVDRALARNPEMRYRSARELQSELAHFLHRADPVVDDETIARFLDEYRVRSDDTATFEQGELSQQQTREIGDSRSAVPLEVRPHARSVTLLQLAFETTGEAAHDEARAWDQVCDLIRDVAFKREAHVVSLDKRGTLLAFGTLWSSDDDAQRAVRVARTLRETIAELAPTIGMGTVLIVAQVTIERSPDGRNLVQLPAGLDDQLHAVARRAMDAEVLVAGGLTDRLGRKWRFGRARPPVPETPPAHAGSPWAAAFASVAPLLGPLSETERRRKTLGRKLFGRELELKTMRDVFSEAVAKRESRSLLLIGDPGLGKGTLVDRFVERLPPGGAAVLRGEGRWSTRNRPLGVFLEILSRHLGVGNDTPKLEIVERLRDYNVEEARMLAEAFCDAMNLPGREESNLDPAERRDRLLRLVRRVIRGIATRRPVVIIIENLHFVDSQSIAAVENFAAQPTPLPVMGLTTSRPGPRVAELQGGDDDDDGRFERLTTVVLGELDVHARRELILSRFEDPEEAEPLAAAILARTGGNPLFIEEILAALLERGTLAWNARATELVVRDRDAEIELPPTIDDALRGRVESLDPRRRTVLHAAAVLGLSFRRSELEEIADALDVYDEVGPAIDDFISTRMLEHDARTSSGGERLRFTTVSLHEVCRKSMLSTNARQMHAHAARIKQARPDYISGRDDGPIAEHLLAAGDEAGAIEPAMRAAKAAIDVGGNVEAYHHLTHALKAMGPEDPRRFEALLAREPILRAWGRRRAQGADVRALVDQAEHNADPTQQIIATTRMLRFYIECGRTHRAGRLVPTLRRMVEQSEDRRRFLAVLGELESEIAFARGFFDEAESLAQDALQYTWNDRRGVRQRFRLLRSLGRVRLHTGRLDLAEHDFDDALQLARSIEDRRLEAEARTLLGEVAGLQTRYQAAVDHFVAALGIDRELGDRFSTGVKLANLGITYAAIGLYRRAQRYLRKALELHEAIGHPALLNDVMVNLGEVSFELGDPVAALSLLDEAAAVAKRRDDIRTELRARAHMVRVLLASGESRDEQRAERIAKGLVDVGRAEGLRSAVVRGLHGLSRIAAARADYARAVELEREACRLIESGAARLDGPRPQHHLGRLLRDHPELGEPGEAQRWLRAAAERVQARLDDLRDPQLRAGYEELDEVQQILSDGA